MQTPSLVATLGFVSTPLSAPTWRLFETANTQLGQEGAEQALASYSELMETFELTWGAVLQRGNRRHSSWVWAGHPGHFDKRKVLRPCRPFEKMPDTTSPSFKSNSGAERSDPLSGRVGKARPRSGEGQTPPAAAPARVDFRCHRDPCRTVDCERKDPARDPLGASLCRFQPGDCRLRNLCSSSGCCDPFIPLLLENPRRCQSTLSGSGRRSGGSISGNTHRIPSCSIARWLRGMDATRPRKGTHP